MAILGFLASIFTGPIIKGVIDSVAQGYRDKLAHENSKDAKAVELAVAEVQAEVSARVQATEVLKAEQGRWWTAAIRPLFAFPLVIYWWKIIMWDKLLGWGSTDALGGHVEQWAMIIIAAYFVTRPFEKYAFRIFKK